MQAMTSSTTIRVRVLLFARYAELLGRDLTELELASPATVGHALERLREQFEGARLLPQRPMCALNERQVGADAALENGDELALLPPLAGG